MKRIDLSSFSNVVILFGIIVVVNILALRYFFRMDISEGKIYTLSESSRNIVGNLEDRLLIKCYFSKSLSPIRQSVPRFLRDKLEEYQAYSHGNLRYEFIDPGTEEALEMEAQNFRIPPFQDQILANDKIEVMKVYMGIALVYGKKSETLPYVVDTNGLEYKITSAIKRITTERTPTVGLLSGHDEPDLYQNLQNLQRQMGKDYFASPINVAGELVPDDVDALLIISPQKPFSDWEKFAIDQFIMRGGKLAIFMNKYSADLQRFTTQLLPLNLDDWLAHYGIRINDDMVIDASRTMIPIRQQMGAFSVTRSVPYPFFPKVINFNRDQIIVQEIETVQMCFPSSVDTSLAQSKNLEVTTLFSSSNRAGRKTGYFMINPYMEINPAEYNEKNIPLAMIIKGPYTSYFKGKPVPPRGDSAGSEEDEESLREPYDGEIIEEVADNRILVMGDGNFIKDDYLMEPSNILFALNAIDWLVQDEGLISIRSRVVTDRPLDEVGNMARKIIKSVNLVGPSLLVIFLGLLVWQYRRVRKRAMEISQ